jgi:hypothetical protein
MREAHIIDGYVESLAGRLSFDQSLARRVRREVEDHLWEAVGRSSAGDGPAAAAQAIAHFGDPQALAAEFATTRLAAMTLKVSAGAILLVGATLVAMKARLAWYGLGQWPLGDELRDLATAVGLVDVYAFWLAAALALGGWVYLIGKPVPASNAALCRQLRHVVSVNCLSASALTISVICDGGLTALRLVGRELSVQCLIPLASMVAEIALIGLLIFWIGGLIVRMTRTTSLLLA